MLEEALILSVFGFPIGLGFSLVLYALARDATYLPITMTFARAVMVLGLTMGMCVLSGVIATRKLRSADPAEVF